MMSIGVILAALMLAGDIAGCYGNSGIRVTVPEALLQRFNTKMVGEFKRNTTGLRFPNISLIFDDISAQLSAFRITDVGETNSTLDLRSGNTLNWTFGTSSITMKSLCWIDLIDGISGSLDITTQSASVSVEVSLGAVNGGVNITLNTCKVVISDFTPSFGGDLDTIGNIIMKVLNKTTIKDQLELEICSHVQGALGKLSNYMQNAILHFERNFTGIPLVLDNQLTNITIDNHGVSTYLKGAVKWNDKYMETSTTFPALPVNSDSLIIDTSQDIINNALKAVIASGSLDRNFSYAQIMANNMTQLYLDNCIGYCVGAILRNKIPGYPNGVLGMHLTSTEAYLKIMPRELIGTFKGIVNFTAEDAYQQQNVFGAHLIMLVALEAKMSQDGFHIRPSAIGWSITIDSSNIGKVFDEDTQELLNIVAAGSIENMFISKFGEHMMKLPTNVTYRGNSVTFHEGVVRVEADICYEKVCQYETKDEWIGKDTIDRFKIIDVLPAEVTTTTTTSVSQRGGQSSVNLSGELFVLSLSIALFRMLIPVYC